MLSQLIYMSVRQAGSSRSDVETILAASRRNNGALDISGVLLYSDSHFFQYIEGEEQTLLQLYDRIKEDPRHQNVVLISRGPIEKRVFPSWEMGGKKIDQNSVEFDTILTPEQQDTFQQILSGKELEGSRATAIMGRLFGEVT